MLFEKDKVLQRWSEYISDLFADNRHPLPIPSNDDGPPIMKEEVEKALKNTKMGKAPGEDGITTDMLKFLESFGVEKLTDLYNDTSSSAPLRCIGRLRRHGSPLRKAPSAPIKFVKRLRHLRSPCTRRLWRLQFVKRLRRLRHLRSPCTRRLRRLQFVKRLRCLRHLLSPVYQATSAPTIC